MDVRYDDRDVDPGREFGPTVVAVGTFDGVHMGHQALLAEARNLAAGLDARSAVVLFDRPPAAAGSPEPAAGLLTDLQHRIELLSALGIDLCYVIRFDEARSVQAPEAFVREVVVDRLAAKALVVGEDFHFAWRPRGDTAALLTELASVDNLKVVGLPLVGLPGASRPVSTSGVREALVRGDVAGAALMLGRPYEVRGVVEHGDHRGRTMGFPTANVTISGDMALPADGIYAGWYERPSGEVHPAAISLGKRPTFYDDHGVRLLEAYLLDFAGDLYTEHAKVRFQTWLRGEVKFGSIEALVEALSHDVEDTRGALSR
jgi:riboflavin kinase/FMN adenylyltransferase